MSRPCRVPLLGDGDALHQCICGHQRHRGTCGKPRYATNDLCRCEEFVDASPQLKRKEDKGMKRLLGMAVLLAAVVTAHGQTLSTQYQHIANTWNATAPLTVCTAGATAPTSCVKDYIITFTDPTGKSNPAVPFAYPATSYTWGPGGFLYCGSWQVNLVIEYYDDQGVAKTTAGNTSTAPVACPFTVSPPSGLKSVPAQ
jgi:hypothetical protein